MKNMKINPTGFENTQQKSPKAKLIPQQENRNRQAKQKIQSFDWNLSYNKKQGKSHPPSEKYESGKRNRKREFSLSL